jgi:hypothetical protein
MASASIGGETTYFAGHSAISTSGSPTGYQSGIDSTGSRTDYETGTTGYESITGLHGIYLNTLYNSNR